MSAKAKVAALKAKAAQRGSDPFVRAAVATGREEDVSQYQTKLSEQAAKAQAELEALQTGQREVDNVFATLSQTLSAFQDVSHMPQRQVIADLAVCERTVRLLSEQFPAPAEAAASHEHAGSHGCCGSAHESHDGHNHQHCCGHAHTDAGCAKPAPIHGDQRSVLAGRVRLLGLEVRYAHAAVAYAQQRYARCTVVCRDLLLDATPLSGPGRPVLPVVLRGWVLRARAFVAMAHGNRLNADEAQQNAVNQTLLQGPVLLANLHVDKALRLLGSSADAATDEVLHHAANVEGSEPAAGARAAPQAAGLSAIAADQAVVGIAQDAVADTARAVKHVKGLKQEVVQLLARCQACDHCRATTDSGGSGTEPSATPALVDVLPHRTAALELTSQSCIMLEEGSQASAHGLAGRALEAVTGHTVRPDAGGAQGHGDSADSAHSDHWFLRAALLLLLACSSGGAAGTASSSSSAAPDCAREDACGCCSIPQLPRPSRMVHARAACYAQAALGITGGLLQEMECRSASGHGQEHDHGGQEGTQAKHHTARRLHSLAHLQLAVSLLELGREGCGLSWIHTTIGSMDLPIPDGLPVDTDENSVGGPGVEVLRVLKLAKSHLLQVQEHAKDVHGDTSSHTGPDQGGGHGHDHGHSHGQDITDTDPLPHVLQVLEAHTRLHDQAYLDVLPRRLDAALRTVV